MSAIRFLNLDLDFFLDDVGYTPPLKRRLNGRQYKPWSKQEVRNFLESQCGLKKWGAIPGRFGTHHDAVFDYWKEILPAMSGWSIELTHVDAHADLGMGSASWLDVMESVLHLPVSQRGDPIRGPHNLNLGSYLTYALACQWISSVAFVKNPNAGDDLPTMLFKNYDPKSGYVELKGFDPGTAAGVGYDISRLKRMTPKIIEPPIPYNIVDLKTFRHTASYDFAFLSHSPNYTPASADNLIAVISEYINFQ